MSSINEEKINRSSSDSDKEAFWRNAFKEQAESGGTIRSYCRNCNLALWQFYYWRRKIYVCDKKSSKDLLYYCH